MYFCTSSCYVHQKIDIWAVTNTQAQPKKVRNHFLCKKSPHPQAIATCWAALTPRVCTLLTIFLVFYLLHYLVCYNVKHHAIVVNLAVRSRPSSSVACWSFKVFDSRLLHCTHQPRASQNGKKTLKLPTLLILLCAVVTHSLLSVKVCLCLAIFCVL